MSAAHIVYISRAVMAVQARSFSEETSTFICWEWSIRPLIILLRIIGVDFPHFSNSSASQRYRWLILVYRAFCFLIHVSCQINILHYFHGQLVRAMHLNNQQTDELSFLETTTALWNTIIDFANYVVHDIGIHVILLTVIRVQWVDTMEIFQRLHVIFTNENYIRIRQISYCGVIYVILLISVLVVITMDSKFLSDNLDIRPFIVNITWITSTIYPLTTIIVFVVHCYASSMAFELIRKEIKRCEIQLRNGRDVSSLLSVFKQNHLIACDAVDCINRTFGRMLLLSTSFFIVAIINVSYVMFTLDDGVSLSSALFLLYTFVHLPLICFAADHISNKAENMIIELMRLKCADEPLKGHEMEMEFLLLDMAQTVPQIYANGYFKVSKRLLPQVIGTTLTYFFILCQFEASEKNQPEDN